MSVQHTRCRMPRAPGPTASMPLALLAALLIHSGAVRAQAPQSDAAPATPAPAAQTPAAPAAQTPVAPTPPSAAPSATPSSAAPVTPAPAPAAGAAPDAPVGGAAQSPAGGTPETAPSAADTRALDEQTQALKKDVVDLNRDLFVLEEELLYPSNTQVAVFLSMDVGTFFALDSVELKVDQKEVANYLYTPREVEALLKGGVQRLYVGNVKVGSHELVAVFTGKGPNDRDYKRGASVRFEKGIGAKYLELQINDRQRRLQPEFQIKDSDQ